MLDEDWTIFLLRKKYKEIKDVKNRIEFIRKQVRLRKESYWEKQKFQDDIINNGYDYVLYSDRFIHTSYKMLEKLCKKLVYLRSKT